MTGANGKDIGAAIGSTAPNTPEYLAAPLPSDCPPDDGEPLAEQIVLRLVPHDPPSDTDFLPSSMLPNRRRPDSCDECRWCSCSVYLKSKDSLQRLRDMTKLKNLKNMKFIAHVKVNGEAGLAKAWPSDPEHISFWALKSFSPVAAMENCEAV
jgi:hypothetical protein